MTVTRLSYRNRLILAPMVRVGTVPMRLLALRFGADIVYSPEIIDRRLMLSHRIFNESLGTIDYVEESGRINLRIHPNERGHLAVQIGSSNPEFAVQAALKVAGDVDAIDLNCGCPKKFSIQGGMGAALLETPDKLEEILTALVAAVSIPVTCKIRLLDEKDGKTSTERTIELMQRIERTGVAAIAVHCRYRHERPRQPAHWDVLAALAQSVNIPVIANGDLWTMEDVHRMRAVTSTHQDTTPAITSFMIARGAQENVSVFRKEGPLPIWDVIKLYLDTANACGMNYPSTKYVILQMWGASEGTPFRHRIMRCKSLEAIKALIDELDHCQGLITFEDLPKTQTVTIDPLDDTGYAEHQDTQCTKPSGSINPE